MTRNNLAEHLRWLLQERPSQIGLNRITSYGNAAQLAQSEAQGNLNDQDNLDHFGDDFDDSVLMRQDDEPVMPQLQPPLGHGVEVQATSPGITARSTERQRALARNQRAISPSAMSVPQTPDARRLPSMSREDVEILDMTDGSELVPPTMASTNAKRTVPRKRKSDEIDPVEPANRASKEQRITAQRAHSFIHDGDMDDVPEGPPPPYSTEPLSVHGRSKSTVLHDYTFQRHALHASNQGEDDLFDFSSRQVSDRAITQPPAAPRPHTDRSEPPGKPNAIPHLNNGLTARTYAAEKHKGSSHAVGATPPASEVCAIPTATPGMSGDKGVASEEVLLLRQFFALPADVVQHTSDSIVARLDAMCDEIATLHDVGGQDEMAAQLSNELEALTALQEAFSSLQKSATKMQWLASKRDEHFANLKKVIRQLNSAATTQAKAANQAAKAELEAFEKECLDHLSVCREEVAATVKATTKAKDAATHVSIQASQLPQRNNDAVPGSPSRVMQTQAHSNHARNTGETFESRRSPVRLDADQNRFSERPHSVDLSARPGLNAYATKTTVNDFMNDEDDFNIDDDDFSELEPVISTFTKPALPAHRTALKERSVNITPSSTGKNKTMLVKHDMPQFADLFSHSWSDDVKRSLKEQFKLTGFRRGQLEAINATLAGKDAFVLMPTGGGKSLCYQLPSQISSGKTKGVTVVVSPLLSLMEDQVQHLRKLSIQAFLLNGDCSQSERKHIWDIMSTLDVAKFIQILYITPEMLSKSQAMLNSLDRLYANKRFARLVIDEAHCVSQWGHDFRPDYKLIGEVRSKFPTVPVMALTATATENVKVDTIHNLSMKGCEVFTRSFNRPNLYYEVRGKGSTKTALADMATLIKENHKGETGIIYCLSRKNCEDTAQALSKEHNIRAAHYHAGMQPAEKSEVQRSWQAGKWHVIVATIAFGMGIDKSNVRFVIHHSVPKSLEGYYQETGRAGRDGSKSRCYLFFSFPDVSKLRRMIVDNEEGSREQKDRQLAMLRQMVQYCDNKADCRRVQVLRYFSEVFQKEDCNEGCDVCTSNAAFSMQDVTELASNAITVVSLFEGEKVTLLQCIEAFRGTKTKDLDSSNKAVGSGRSLDRSEAERLFNALIDQGALEEYQVFKGRFPHQYVRLGSRARSVKHLELAMRMSPGGKTKQSSKATASKRAKKAAPELPLSTNVSSPVQAISARRKKAAPIRNDSRVERYRYDGFAVPDDEDDKDYEESDSDAFESISRNTSRRVSAPITTDGVLDDLDELHQSVVEDFMQRAGHLARTIASKDNLRGPLFPDNILRQMAIRFTVTKDEMNTISGIKPEQVEHYGTRFAKLVKQCRQSYEEMKGDNDTFAGTAQDPNGNVINLCTDEEDNLDSEEDEYGDFEGLDIDENDFVASTARQVDSEVDAFNERFAESQSIANRTKTVSDSKSKGPWKHKKRGYRAVSGGSRGEGSSRGRGKSSARSGKHSGVAKKSSTRRSTESAARPKTLAKSSFISAMPT